LKTEDCGCTLNPIAELVLGEAGGVIKSMEPLGSWLIGSQEVPPKGLADECLAALGELGLVGRIG
jgi:hypothetical protein